MGQNGIDWFRTIREPGCFQPGTCAETSARQYSECSGVSHVWAISKTTLGEIGSRRLVLRYKVDTNDTGFGGKEGTFTIWRGTSAQVAHARTHSDPPVHHYLPPSYISSQSPYSWAQFFHRILALSSSPRGVSHSSVRLFEFGQVVSECG